MRLHAFRALRPAPHLAARVAAPPYDVVSRAEAARLAGDESHSFLRVTRAEVDLPDAVDAHDPRVYARARENLDRMVAGRVLLRDERPALYLYRQEMAGRAQIGVVGCVDVDDYERGVIRKHETTRPDKEDDRTRHILALEAQAEPVLLMYRDQAAFDRLAREATARSPLYAFAARDGVRQTVWPVQDVQGWVAAFDAVPAAYVADGHHRSASAWRVARALRGAGEGGETERERFLAVLFPASQLRILPYNRVVADLGGMTPPELLGRLRQLGRLEPTREAAPARPGAFSFYLEGRWHQLVLPEDSIDHADPLRSLDVSLLAERVLGPVLGIEDQRTDTRIDFVGGIHGPRELERRVDSGAAALGIALHPTTVGQLMAVSDLGRVMPPKSTWFEPKLQSGLFIHPFR